MSAAFQVVRPGGSIVCAAECRDGFPDHGSYREVLASAASPQALLDAIAARDRDRARPVAGADPGAHPGRRAGWSCTPRYLSDADLADRPSGADRRHLGHASPRRWPRPGRAPGCACCRRARRPSPTWPADRAD